MHRRDFMTRIVATSLLGSAGGLSSGCGTLLYSERCGQPHSYHIDWKVAALDGLGLICFFVPGVIAFVVDFTTGAIYLPPGMVSSTQAVPSAPPVPAPEIAAVSDIASDFARVDVPPQELSKARLEEVVTTHVGQPIALEEENTRLSELSNLDQFAGNCESHRKNRKFGFGLGRLLERFHI